MLLLLFVPPYFRRFVVLTLGSTIDGPEREAVIAKFEQNGYSKKEAEKLVSHVDIYPEQEQRIEDSVFAYLSETLVGGDPGSAFELLMFWVSLASEKSEPITHADFISKLNSIGRYLFERRGYHSQWGTSIEPLDNIELTPEHIEHLRNEYRQGIDARYEHVVANLDIVRDDKSFALTQAFEKAKIVIVHGASGQGKSTVAYRYLHDCIPDQWKFRIRYADDKARVMEIANALLAHAKAVGLPFTVYLDISVNDNEWPELVRELSSYPLVNVLVTIREEDWQRTYVPKSRFLYEDFELTFDQEEARRIYTGFAENNPYYLSFEDAWGKFGGRGPLLEFAFLTTQNKSLEERIREQITTIQDRVRQGELHVNELKLTQVATFRVVDDGNRKR